MQETISLLQSIPVWNDSAFEYVLALAIFLGSISILKLIKEVLLNRLSKLAKRTHNDIDDLIIASIQNIKSPFFVAAGLFVGSHQLTLPYIVSQIILVIFYFAVVYEIVQIADTIVDFFAKRFLQKKEGVESDEQQQSLTRIVQLIVRIILWSLGLLVILSNLGVDVTSLIASLGIGGLAVALALQSILSDVFSSLSIYIDKPFEVGDFIIVGTDMGTVEKIGLKTTRLQSMKGEELILANKELTTARIQNFKRMEKRRETFQFGVLYETTPEQLQKLPNMVQQIIERQELAEFDRCHLASMGDFALLFEVVYFVQSTEYNVIMDVRQAINLELIKSCARENIGFAYPTQTLYLNK